VFISSTNLREPIIRTVCLFFRSGISDTFGIFKLLIFLTRQRFPMEIYNYNAILNHGIGNNPIGLQYEPQRGSTVSAFTSDSGRSGNWTYYELSQV
jgi:hypothetical protein